jgi:hypothetical protein
MYFGFYKWLFDSCPTGKEEITCIFTTSAVIPSGHEYTSPRSDKGISFTAGTIKNLITVDAYGDAVPAHKQAHFLRHAWADYHCTLPRPATSRSVVCIGLLWAWAPLLTPRRFMWIWASTWRLKRAAKGPSRNDGGNSNPTVFIISILFIYYSNLWLTN